VSNNIAHSGSQFTIEFAEVGDGSMPAKSFLDHQEPKFQARMYALFKRLGDSGRIANQEQFKKLTGEFWEFKSFQIRMPCYFAPGRRLVVTHGFIKKKDAVSRQEKERAASIKAEYEARRLKH
jgi:hypothetical protein